MSNHSVERRREADAPTCLSNPLTKLSGNKGRDKGE